MNILLKNIPNTYNYGSMMMAENIITYLNRYVKKQINYYTEARSDEDLLRLKKATEYDKIYKDNQLHIKLLTENIKYVRFFERKIKTNLMLKRAARFYDAIIILGGDDFAETYYNLPDDNPAIKKIFQELKIFNKNTKLFMISQTIGPYTGKRLTWAKKYFKNIKIYSRDHLTAEYMKNVINKEIIESRDLAFLDLNLQFKINKETLLKKYNLKENEYLTIVGTGLVTKYGNDKLMIKEFCKLVLKLKKEFPNKKIVYLSHVLTPNTKFNDNYIYNEKKSFFEKECVCIVKPILPAEARVILGNGLFTITCRMHAAVSTFQMCKPAICLSYSRKYKGVIAEGLDLKELVIDAVGDKFWHDKFISKVFEKINYLLFNKDLNQKIKNKVNECQIMIEKVLKDISKDLE